MTEIISVGIDYSTRKFAAVALLGGRRRPRVFSSFVDKKLRNDDLALTAIGDYADSYFNTLIKHIGPDKALSMRVCIEEPIVGHNGNRRLGVRMGMVAGAVYQIASQYTDYVFTVPVSTWKKEVCGAGNLKKADVIEWLNTNEPAIGKHCHNDDETDSACIALYAQNKWSPKDGS